MALAGAVVLTTAPAHAAPVVTDYGFATSAFGTQASAEQVGLRSAKTAYSYLSCTRRAGLLRTSHLAAVDAPSNNPFLTVGAVDSSSATYKNVARRTVGTRSTNDVAKVVLGEAGNNLTIRGLRTTAEAWATTGDGKLHAKPAFSAVDIAATGTPVDSLFSGPDGINALFNEIAAEGGVLSLPGIGEIRAGVTGTRFTPEFGSADATALNVVLFGLDGVKGGTDDTRVTIGRSYAKVTRNLRAGVMRGSAYGLDADLLDGTSSAGRLVERPLPCQGTGGKILTSDALGTNLGNADAVEVGAATARVFGVQRQDRSAKAWTEGRVANVMLGNGVSQLKIQGIVGRANVEKSKTGRITSSTQGSRVASITVGGQEASLPAPGQDLVVPGVARVSFFIRKPDPHGIQVTAVRIEVLDETSGVGVINLGVARTYVKPF